MSAIMGFKGKIKKLKKSANSDSGVVVGIATRPSLKDRLAKVFSTKKRRLFALATIVMLVAGGSLWFFVIRDNTQEAALLPCGSDDTLMAKVIITDNKNDRASFDTIANQIQSRDGYEQDPNCHYALALYYIDKGDAKRARDAYEEFVKTVENEEDINGYLRNGQSGLAQKLEEEIKFYDKLGEVLKTNLEVNKFKHE